MEKPRDTLGVGVVSRPPDCKAVGADAPVRGRPGLDHPARCNQAEFDDRDQHDLQSPHVYMELPRALSLSGEGR